MQDKLQPFSPASLLTGAIVAVLFVWNFNPLFFPLGGQLITTGGDGIKNYFTPAWYVAYDSGTHFSGMHYPYGDNVVYSDNQPLVSWTLRLVFNTLHIDAGYVPFAMHLLMLLSFAGCGMLLASILSRWLDKRSWVIFFAVLITCMSPQTERMYAHFSLAYPVFFPLIWWLHIRAKEHSYSTSSLVWLALGITVFAFLHLYYLLIAIAFSLALLVFQTMRKEITRAKALQMLVAVILPFFLLLLYTQFTDTVTDRPERPFGFFFYKASFQSVFIPPYGPLSRLWHEQLHWGRTNMEGYAWVGHFGLLMLAGIVVWSLLRYIRKKTVFPVLPASFLSNFYAALLLLAFSMALPFSLGLEKLLDIIPFLQQFRSPGRFSWAFYYVFMVGCVVILYRLHQLAPFRRAHWLVAVAAALLTYDSVGYWLHTGKNIRANAGTNAFVDAGERTFFADMLGEAGYTAKDFQAMMFLPFYHSGSEKLYIEKGAGHMYRSMSDAYTTGLPMLNTMMSRTSISQSLEVSALAGHPLISKHLPTAMDARPLLLVTADAELNIPENYMAGQGQLLGRRDGYSYYRLDTAAFHDTKSALLQDFYTLRDTVYINQGAYYARQPLQFFEQALDYNIDFSADLSEEKDLGKYGLYRTGKAEQLLEIKIPPPDTTIWMEISFWSYTFNETTAYPPLKIEWLKQDGTVFRREDISAKSSADIIGRWVRASGYFEVIPDCAGIRITLLDHPRTLINNLLVRDTREHVFYRLDNNMLWFNGYPISQQ